MGFQTVTWGVHLDKPAKSQDATDGVRKDATLRRLLLGSADRRLVRTCRSECARDTDHRARALHGQASDLAGPVVPHAGLDDAFAQSSVAFKADGFDDYATESRACTQWVRSRTRRVRLRDRPDGHRG
jgi:hypothetical protein